MTTGRLRTDHYAGFGPRQYFDPLVRIAGYDTPPGPKGHIVGGHGLQALARQRFHSGGIALLHQRFELGFGGLAVRDAVQRKQSEDPQDGLDVHTDLPTVLVLYIYITSYSRSDDQPLSKRRSSSAPPAALSGGSDVNKTFTALAVIAALALSSGCARSTFMQNPYEAIPKSTPAQMAQVHQPQALRADLDAIVALHERTNPNPYLRVSRESIRALAERLKASIDRPMTRREFLPFVMELQAGYRSDHYAQGVPSEDLEAALARGERLLPFRAEPTENGLIVVAVAEGERAIEPGDTLVKIGSVSVAHHLSRLRALVPDETARYRDTQVRERYRSLAWATGITLPTQVEVIRPDGSRRTVMVEGVGGSARKTERSSAGGMLANTQAESQREVLIDSPPFRALLLPGDAPTAAPVAVIEFPTMDGPLGRQWDKFLDQAITAIKQRGAAGLIVDIRGNGGGNSELGDALLARINDRPYRMASRVVWRKSAESDQLFRMGTKPMWRPLMFALPLFLPDYSALKYGEDLTYETDVAGRSRVDPSFDGPTALC